MASPIITDFSHSNILAYNSSNIETIGTNSFNTSNLPKDGGTGELRIHISTQPLCNYGTVAGIVIDYKAYGTRTGILGSKAQIRTGYWDGASGSWVTSYTHGDVGRGSGNATSYTDTFYPYVSSLDGSITMFFHITNPIASQTNQVYVHSISITVYYTPDYSTIYTVALPASGGTISGGGTYECGTPVTLTAVPNNGYKFIKWSDGTDANPRSITVGNNDATYTAEFESDKINKIYAGTPQPQIYIGMQELKSAYIGNIKEYG